MRTELPQAAHCDAIPAAPPAERIARAVERLAVLLEGALAEHDLDAARTRTATLTPRQPSLY